MMNKKMVTVFLCPDTGYWGLLEPGLEVEVECECGPAPVGSGQAQPGRAMWLPFPMGSPPVEGAKRVGRVVSWAVAKGRGLGGPIYSV